jgi:hypothetical protein
MKVYRKHVSKKGKIYKRGKKIISLRQPLPSN